MSAIKLLVISVMGLFPPDLMDGKTAPGCEPGRQGRAGAGLPLFIMRVFLAQPSRGNWASSNYIIHTTITVPLCFTLSIMIFLMQ